MIWETTLASLLVAAPAAAAVWIFLRRPRGMESGGAAIAGCAGSAVALAAAGLLLAGEFRGVVGAFAWAPGLGVEVSWRLETAPLALAVLVALIGGLVTQYAGAYFGASGADGGKGTRAIALLSLFESSMLGLVLADNLFLLFVFWELTGICSFFLISLDADRRSDAFPAARQALLVTAAGGLSMLVAFVYLRAAAGSASLAELTAGGVPPAVATVAFALLLPAVVTKSAQIPFHFWLPGAMAAPSPISAYLHSATMVKAGLLLLLWVYPFLGATPLWSTLLVPLGAATCVWGSYRALGEDDIKLLMAWSTVSQLGLLTLTLGLGTDLAVRAALLHLFAHAVFKAGLFLTVGAVDHAAHTRSLPRLGGLGRRAPLLFAAAAVLAASMAGIPPLAGFLSKELILKKAMLAELWVHAVAIGGIVAGSVGTVAYSSRFAFETFTGDPRSDGAARAHHPGAGLLAAPLALAALSLAAGLGAPWVDRWFLEPVTASILGHGPETKPLSLWYGLEVAFLLSAGIVAAGYGCDRLLGLRLLPRRIPGLGGRDGGELFGAFLEASAALGARLSRALAEARPAVYLGLALICGLAGAVPLLSALSPAGAAAPAELAWNASGLAVVALLAAALTALLALENRLARVLLLSAAGFAVALLYRLMSAPDLLLTQLLVEVLTTVFFVLAVRRLPRRGAGPRAAGSGRLGRAAVAIAAGAVLAALVLAVEGARGRSAVREIYLAAAPEVAKGWNAVNVILTDFRALDTLVETLVVVVAALGVAGLLRGREMVARRRREEP